MTDCSSPTAALETELVFHDGIDLPHFAAFPLLENAGSRARLRRYYDGYLDIARRHGAGFVIETPDLARQPGLGRASSAIRPTQLDAVNRAGGTSSPRRSGRRRPPTASLRW